MDKNLRTTNTAQSLVVHVHALDVSTCVNFFFQLFIGIVEYSNGALWKVLHATSVIISAGSIHYRATIGPPAKRHSNGVLLVDR